MAGCDLDEMCIGSVFAVPKLLAQHGLTVKDIDLWEMNEAFAVQAIYCRDRLVIDPEIYNVNGGAIVVVDPYGMSGASGRHGTDRWKATQRFMYAVVIIYGGDGTGAASLFEIT